MVYVFCRLGFVFVDILAITVHNVYICCFLGSVSTDEIYLYFYNGEVSEWLIEPVSKTGVPFAGTAGSNPALSVNFLRAFVSA